MTNLSPDPIAAAGIRCYEVFRDGSLAFEREGQLCFGPASKLSAFLSGSGESFLTGDAAQNKIDSLHATQHPTRSKPQHGNEADGFAQTRKRWETERSKGQWNPRIHPPTAQRAKAPVSHLRPFLPPN
jgi:hypothetical protein